MIFLFKNKRRIKRRKRKHLVELQVIWVFSFFCFILLFQWLFYFLLFLTYLLYKFLLCVHESVCCVYEHMPHVSYVFELVYVCACRSTHGSQKTAFKASSLLPACVPKVTLKLPGSTAETLLTVLFKHFRCDFRFALHGQYDSLFTFFPGGFSLLWLAYHCC